MSKNRKLLVLLMVILSACTTDKIPKAYNFTLQESRANPYGCWTKLTYSPGSDTLSVNSVEGELICMTTDTISLLVKDYVIQQIFTGSVRKAELITHQNQARKYFTRTAIFLIPNILAAVVIGGNLFPGSSVDQGFATGFLALGFPVALTGFTQAAIEGFSHKNRIMYPGKKDLFDIRIYARFPYGKPAIVDLNRLTLKKLSK